MKQNAIMRTTGRRRLLGLAALLALATLGGCGESVVGEDVGQISVATGVVMTEADLVLTEADAGRVIEAPTFSADIGLPDKKGVILTLEGDDASSLRWRFAEKPDPFVVEWYGVDDRLAFETGDLIGDPTTAKRVLEFRPSAVGEAVFVLELVERDPADRGDAPVKRLEYTFSVCFEPGTGGSGAGCQGQTPCPNIGFGSATCG